jgi:hypothetical protein
MIGAVSSTRFIVRVDSGGTTTQLASVPEENEAVVF